MRSWIGRVGPVRALIAVVPGLVLVVLGIALFLLYENDERERNGGGEVRYSAQYTCETGPPEKKEDEADDNGSRPEGHRECFDVELTSKAPVGAASVQGFGFASFMLVATGLLTAVGMVAVLYVAGDRRAAERGILQAAVVRTRKGFVFQLVNVGKTPVRLQACDVGAHFLCSGDSPVPAVWTKLPRVSLLVSPVDDGAVKLDTDPKRYKPGQRVAVLFEYEDVFGDVWRGYCWFTKQAGTGSYVRDSEAEQLRWWGGATGHQPTGSVDKSGLVRS